MIIIVYSDLRLLNVCNLLANYKSEQRAIISPISYTKNWKKTISVSSPPPQLYAFSHIKVKLFFLNYTKKKNNTREKRKKSIIYLHLINRKHSLRARVDADANDHLLIYYQDNS